MQTCRCYRQTEVRIEDLSASVIIEEKKKKAGTKTSRALPFPGRIRAEGLTRTVSGDSRREKADVEEAEKIVTHTRIVKTTSSRSGLRGTPGLRGQQLALIAGCDRNAKLWPGGSRSD